MKKSILFIHNKFPSEGASGNVVFLRHFEGLGEDYEIHIAVSENLKGTPVPNYSKNFHIHYIPLRKKAWPPFRESSTMLVQARIFLWQKQIEQLIQDIEPVCVISVLAHYLCVAAAQASYSKKIPFILFVHDRWDYINIHDPEHLKNQKLKFATKALNRANHILTVSESLVSKISKQYLSKTKLLFPIPSGLKEHAVWTDEMKGSTTIIHAGTINKYAVNVFTLLADKVLEPADKLKLIYVPMDFLEPLLYKYRNVSIIDFFPKSIQALEYVKGNATALLVYYGLSFDENPLAYDSFPSRFVEFTHTGVPIICIAPTGSEFHTFLKAVNWPLLYDEGTIENIKDCYDKLKNKQFWDFCAAATRNVAAKFFNPKALQSAFKQSLEQEN